MRVSPGADGGEFQQEAGRSLAGEAQGRQGESRAGLQGIFVSPPTGKELGIGQFIQDAVQIQAQVPDGLKVKSGKDQHVVPIPLVMFGDPPKGVRQQIVEVDSAVSVDDGLSAKEFQAFRGAVAHLMQRHIFIRDDVSRAARRFRFPGGHEGAMQERELKVTHASLSQEVSIVIDAV